MRALLDRHHDGLFYSLQLLFEDRLGCEVFTPIGHEWWDEGIWRFGQVYGDDRLAKQFLEGEDWSRGWVEDAHHPGRPIVGITYAEAREMDWDYVVATVQDNEAGFARFASERGARYVLQVGNTNQGVDWSLDPLALVSSEVPILGRGIVYHQEFDTKTIFDYRRPTFLNVVSSFVNCFSSTPVYALWEQAKALLPSVAFYAYGIDGTDGNVERTQTIADYMATSAFGWHDKVQGDGFGHVIHYWAAIGRPLIGHSSHYRGLMAEPFWQDGVTCIDLDHHSLEEATGIIRDISPADHEAMCRAIRATFDRLVDFDAEGERIAGFLS